MQYEDDDEEEFVQEEETVPESPLLKVWKPSANYRYELRDITEQYTPAEDYRQKLVTAGREKRVLQRLEWKWTRHFDLWTRCATVVKAGYRGMLGRRYFNKVREELQLKLAQRRCKEQAKDAYYNNDSALALQIIAEVPMMNRDLYIIKFKILYTTAQYSECITCTTEYLAETPGDHDATYLLASACTMEGRLQEAYDRLNAVLAMGKGIIIDEIYILHAHLCIKLHSNTVSLHSQAVSDFDYLIQQHPEELNFVLQRGMVYSMLQEYDSAIADFDFILYYQPSLSIVLCLRARCHAAKRNWDAAKLDYDTLLYYDPDNAEAQLGIADIIQPYDDLPMIDPEFVKGYVKGANEE